MKDEIYTFKVSLKKNIYRTIQMKGATSLYHFAKAIVKSYGFYFDHSFGFYDNIHDTYESNEEYTLFYDCGEPVSSNEQSVKFSYIYKVFKPSKKMAFLFDYGDDWVFVVNCLGVSEPEEGKKYPFIITTKGKAPEQYPPCD